MASKSFSAFFFLSLLLFGFAYVSDARRDPGEYWKSVMFEEAMPKAIKDLVTMNPPTSNSNTKTDGFVRDFDVKPNVIIYHNHDHSRTEKEIPSDVEG